MLFAHAGRQESEDENIQLDTGRGVSGVLREVLAIVCQQNGAPRSRRLGYLNAAVRAIAKILALGQNKQSPLSEEANKQLEEHVSLKDKASSPPAFVDFGEEEFTRDQYFCLLVWLCCVVWTYTWKWISSLSLFCLL